jgi:hypothetical protein
MFEEIQGQEVQVTATSSEKDGGCNGCTSYITGNGQIEHKVWQIHLRGIYFRVCAECKKELIRLLQSR